MTEPAPGRSPGTPRLGADFQTRVVSAIAMSVLALSATWAGGWYFVALVIAGGAVLIWEWAGMTGGRQSGPVFWVQFATIAAMIIAVTLPAFWVGLLPLWSIVWTAGTVLLIWLVKDDGPEDAVTGLVYIALPATGLVWLRNDPELGLEVIFFLFIVVWGTDILAYVCGRYFGGPKLWPAVSPKKTWSGALGGTAAAIIGGVLMATSVPGTWWLRIAGLALFLSVISQIGDLAESALKRHYNIKDSSGLIPGHGGLLDRVDGLLFAAFAATLFAMTLGPGGAPARTLLVGAAG